MTGQPQGMIADRCAASLERSQQRRRHASARRRVARSTGIAASLVAVVVLLALVMPRVAVPADHRVPVTACWSYHEPAYSWRECAERQRANHEAAARVIRKLRAKVHTRPGRTLAEHPSWLVNAFLCIHSHEGAWNANTGNGYYGGLQMDYDFMRSYGPSLLASKGTADNWTPAEQIDVAIRAYRSGRGFYPWPNTARMCGLI